MAAPSPLPAAARKVAYPSGLLELDLSGIVPVIFRNNENKDPLTLSLERSESYDGEYLGEIP